MHRRSILLLSAAAAALSACGGSSSNSSGGSAAVMSLVEVTNGFGQLVPYTIRKLDATGSPTGQIISIRSQQDLIDNLQLDNQVRPVPQFPVLPILSTGAAGNHFVAVRFTQDIDISTVLDAAPGALASSSLTGALSIIALDPVTGESVPVQGRAFINGMTYAGTPTGSPPQLELQQWLELGAGGQPVALTPEAMGFPGTESNFNDSDVLVSPNTFVFVVDDDGDLSDHDTFPVGRQIQVRVSRAVRATNGKSLEETVLGSSTVGADFLSPEVSTTPPPLNAPLISPGNGEEAVDPLTNIQIQFTEPVQPLSVGVLDGASDPNNSDSIAMEFGPATMRTTVPFTVRPVSIFDFSVFQLVPAFNFPGAGPQGNECGTFSDIDINVTASQGADLRIIDLAANTEVGNPDPIPNGNLFGVTTMFSTGEGPGIVNAPVAPDTIYVGRFGANPGLSVVDLNGYGQSTGTPLHDADCPIQENRSNFPNNPNINQPALVPSLQAGTCTIDGGSAGIFTLTKDSALGDLLVRPPMITSINDMMIGQPLERTFNNAQTFGCQSGIGNACAQTGLKILAFAPQGTTLAPPSLTGGVSTGLDGGPNIITWAPHPNPPPIIFPPLCLSPFLQGQEPSSIDNGTVGNLLTGNIGVFNLLTPGGAPLGNPALCIPPDGLLTPEQNAFFVGPSTASVDPTQCQPFMIRQQVGHFLYVIDRQRGEIVVLNSNRMTVVDRIPVPDPTSLAMGSNVDFLAVSNQQADVVSFIDINPASSTFHQVIKTTVVGDSPRGIAWEPDNEDILVCNEGSNSLSVIDAGSFEVRNTVSSQLNGPFEVAITPRQNGFGFLRGVYFAYILNRTGTVAIFESGPNGVNGWGFDDMIGIIPIEFRNPKTIQPDPVNLNSSAWIVHEGPINPVTNEPGPFGEGALSNIAIESGISGQLSLGGGILGSAIPQFRDMAIEVTVSLGEDRLSGVPVDIAFDNQRNIGGWANLSSTFSAGAPAPANGKNIVRLIPPGTFVNTTEPQFMFAAVPNANSGSGVVDVIRISASGTPRVDTNPFQIGTQSIPAPNANFVVDYFRQ